jgi:hypothetical protein
MIRHDLQCIFVEIPRTASTSIRSIIGKPAKAHRNIVEIKYDLETLWTHYGGRTNRLLGCLYPWVPISKRAHIGRKKFFQFFKFSFVRNPWDRVVSIYKFNMKRHGDLASREKGSNTETKKDRFGLEMFLSFEEFVSWIQYSSATSNHAAPHRYQLDWLTDSSGNLLMNFIGSFESLESDWDVVADILRIDASLPHLNRINAKHYTEYYSEKTKAMVAEKFRVDIETFGYEFDTGPQLLAGINKKLMLESEQFTGSIMNR